MSTAIDILLHDHGDGSNTVLPIFEELYRLSGLQFPPKELKDAAPESIVNFLKNPYSDIPLKFDLITRVLRNQKSLVLFASNFVKTRASQGIKYTEMRFAPQYSVKDRTGNPTGMTICQVLRCLIEGIKEGERACPDIEVNIVASVGREISCQEGVELVKDFARADPDHEYIVGIDLVCVEPGNPPFKFFEMYKKAKKLGFKCTCHAGEWVAEPPIFKRDISSLNQNVWEALKMGADRIGHATAIAYDNELLFQIMSRKIGIEGCPASNLTGKLVPNLACLKVKTLLRFGVLYSVSPDDDLFLPDINETLRLLNKEYYLTPENIALMRRNAWKTRFGHRKPDPNIL